jgi:hypothetical protein
MEKDEIFDRILYLIDSQADGNIAKFARIIGSGDQTVRSIVKNRRNFPGYEVLLNILNAFEWLSPEWLMQGTGEMKKQDYDKIPKVVETTEDYVIMKDKLVNMIESQQRTIENLSKKGNDTA